MTENRCLLGLCSVNPATVRSLQSIPVASLGYQVFFHKEVMLEHFKLNIFIFVLSRVLFPHCKCPHHFSAKHDDKINDGGFKFSVACKWHVLIEEDKDDSLQFAKVCP